MGRAGTKEKQSSLAKHKNSTKPVRGQRSWLDEVMCDLLASARSGSPPRGRLLGVRWWQMRTRAHTHARAHTRAPFTDDPP